MTETTMNLRGLKCPLPALRVRKMLPGLTSGSGKSERLVSEPLADKLEATQMLRPALRISKMDATTEPASRSYRSATPTRPRKTNSPPFHPLNNRRRTAMKDNTRPFGMIDEEPCI